MTKQVFNLTLTVFLLSGCGIPSKDTAVLFSDEFANPGSGWFTWSDEKTSAEYMSGEYVLSYYQYNTRSSSYTDELFDLSDIEVRFVVKNPQASPFLEFGIYCDYQDDDNFYSFLVSTNGCYRIVKFVEGVRTVLTPMIDNDEWACSKDIPNQATSYNFRAECAKSTLSLYIDEKEIALINDPDHARGGVRLRGGYFGHEVGKIYFDDFIVSQK